MASGLLRARPLDVDKKVPIVRRDVELEEPEGISRSVPEMPTGMEAEDEEEAHIQEAIKQSLKAVPDKVSIPTPDIRTVKGYDEEKVDPFVPPIIYIRYYEKTNDDLDPIIEYDLDSEDRQFLKQCKKENIELSEDVLEAILDRMEKEANRQDKIITWDSARTLEYSKTVQIDLLERIFEHWEDRRKSQVNPLNYRFIKPPDPEDPSPFKAFRPRYDDGWNRKRVRKNDNTSYWKLKQLRVGIEKARLLLEMIIKREQHKQKHVSLFGEMLDHLLELPAEMALPFLPETTAEISETQPSEETVSTPPMDLFEEPPMTTIPAAVVPAQNPTVADMELFQDLPKKAQFINKLSPFQKVLFYEEEQEMETFSRFPNIPTSLLTEKVLKPKPIPAFPNTIPTDVFFPVGNVTILHNSEEASNMIPGDQLQKLEMYKVDDLPDVPPFYGVKRIGRGGRVLIEPLKAPMLNGGQLVKEFVTDIESHSRIGPAIQAIETGEHPALGGSSSANDLLDMYTKLYEEEMSKQKKNLLTNSNNKDVRKRTKRF